MCGHSGSVSVDILFTVTKYDNPGSYRNITEIKYCNIKSLNLHCNTLGIKHSDIMFMNK